MPPSRRLTESPWFWAYLFGTAALVALALISPKYGFRQTQIENQTRFRLPEGTSPREAAAAPPSATTTPLRAAPSPRFDPPAPSGSPPYISLRPLFFGLAAITILAGLSLMIQRAKMPV